MIKSKILKINNISSNQVTAPLLLVKACLNQWLLEENLVLNPRDKARVTGLIARYFLHEEALDAAVILSFLRHYRGPRPVDMEDIGGVKAEIARTLERATPSTWAQQGRMLAAVLGLLMATVLVLIMAGAGAGQQAGASRFGPGSGAEESAQAAVTAIEAEHLKSLVAEVVAAEKQAGNPQMTHQALWSSIKDRHAVRSYRQLSRAAYREASGQLQQRLARLQALSAHSAAP